MAKKKPHEVSQEDAPEPEGTEEQPESEETEEEKPHFQVIEEKEETPPPDETAANEHQDTHEEKVDLHDQIEDNESASEPMMNEPENQTSETQDYSYAPSGQHDFRINRRGKKNIPWVPIGIGLGVVGVGLLLWRLVFANPQSTPETTEILLSTPSPLPSPSPSPSATELKREDMKIQVLNGSGVAGAAGKVKSSLETAGYENVGTGNADNYDYKGITIQVKDGKRAIGDLIEGDLEDDYKDITVRETLEDDSDYDAVVIAGSQPGDQTASPSPSPSPTATGSATQ